MSLPKEAEERCIFCRIIAGESPVSMIYEDGQVLVFLALYPINTGHVLVVPRGHRPYLDDLSEDSAMHMMKVARRMAAAIRKSRYESQRVNLYLADGEAAGQDVFHAHMHVYPRFVADGFGFKYDPRRHHLKADREVPDEVAAELRMRL